MKKTLIFRNLLSTFVLMFILILTGCSENSSENSDQTEEGTMEGIIAMIEGNQILLIEDATSEEIQGLSEEEILNQPYTAAYITLPNNTDEVNIGDKVRVWVENLDASSPANGEANKLEVLEEDNNE